VRRGRRVPAGARRAPQTASSAEGAAAEPSVRRSPLLLFMLGSLGLGLVVMLASEAWYARVVGVVSLFAFIVAGVFLIADPAFLAAEEDAP
jgi:hypothetical protein